MSNALPVEFAARCRHFGLADDGQTLEGAAALAERDIAAAQATASPLTDCAVLRAQGADAVDFLNNLLTNDVKSLPAGALRMAGFCTPKGRLLALFHVLRDPLAPDDLLLILPAELAAPMAKKLSMYILRSKVRLTDATAEWAVFGIASPAAASVADGLAAVSPPLCFDGAAVLALNHAAPPALGVVLAPAGEAPAAWTALRQALPAVGLAAWRGLEIAAGLPRIVAATQEAFVPQMLNMELQAVAGINFRKGCYPGQEIVARTQYLGKIKRRMHRALLPAATVPGAPLFAPETGDQQCGAVVSVAPAAGGSELLVCVQSGAVEAGDVRVGSVDGPRLAFATLPYDLDGPDTRAS